MDFEKAKRRQSLKVIISEAIMVLAVIITVTILAFLVSGYWVNSDFEIERQGMLQISSIPTGADVFIDNESSWLQRTNTSKILPSGEHTITLSKEGYDSWSKTINISEGLLYRIHYPLLFLKNRKTEKVMTVSNGTVATVSPDHKYLLLINDSLKWSFVDLNGEKVKNTSIDVSKIIPKAGKILQADWDHDNNRVLFKIDFGDSTEWIILDVRNPEKSINLTKEFGSNFSEIKILDNSANNLLAVQNNNLHKIDVPSKSLSAVLVKDVVNFDHYDNEIVFSTKDYIGFIELGDDEVVKLMDTNGPVKVTLSKFYDDKYITVLKDKAVSVYKKEDFAKILDFETSFIPNYTKVGEDGEFVIMSSEKQIATLDMESNSLVEWSIDTEKFDWISGSMIYTVSDGKLTVYDYDGLNRRDIAKNVSNNFPVAITNNKWLYYFSDNTLFREAIND